MNKDLTLSVCLGLLLGAAHGFAQTANAVPVTPNFTTGTVTSRTESSTTVNESIRQIDFQTGYSYTVTGTNITIPSHPHYGATYQMTTAGEPFQFSETYLGPGQSRITEIDRVTTMTSVTESLSVFTQ